MNNFFSRKTIIIFLSAVLTSLILAILSVVSDGRVSPVGSVINAITSPIQGITSSISDFFGMNINREEYYENLEVENERLRNELAAAQQAARENDALGKENVQLRAALGLRERDRTLVFEPAEVIAKNSDNWSRTYTINKGTNSGINIDNCVVTTEGMVGYVSEVGSSWATVTSITDASIEVSAIASRTRDVASIEGSFDLMVQGLLRLSFLPRDTQLLEGDMIETSGFGGLFPKGIVLGSVVEVKSEEHGISKYAIIKPAVNVENVSHVLVIKSFSITE
ncbi:MAG: rod shape-determining protein MreC [Ruminococcaceae bacterium]|nr:rod shape-determining protein MreC [Oscillospiraceae bacterium]